MAETKPSRCIDPVVKFCQGCPWGWVHYPEWVETSEDLDGCCFESGCTLGYDQGRPEDEPTEAELTEFEELNKKSKEVDIMNWKYEAIDKLTQYEAKRQSLRNIPDEIARLESVMCGIRSATSDGSPVKGGGSGREDMMLNNIVLREELERSLEQAQRWVDLVDVGLSLMSAEDRKILDRFFINPVKGAADRLADELHLDVKTVYRRKDGALRRFTVSLYGSAES